MRSLNSARSRAARLILVGLIAVLTLLGTAAAAQAHPFGTPPVAKVTSEGREVDVTWSAQKDDIAVLGKQAAGDEAAYLGSHISVGQSGHACRLDGADTSQLARKGAVLRYLCPEPVDDIALTVTALTDVDRAYRTISVTESGAGGLHTAAEPTRTLALAAGGSPAASASTAPDSVWTSDLAALLEHRVVLPLALLVCAAVGAFHALAPGHGKSLAAGYLVGGEGRARDAVWLGAVVAVMHTFSVATLAVGWWLAAESAPDIAALTGWLQLIAAMVVVAVGVGLLRRHLRNRSHGHHHHNDHDHDGHHGHSHHIPTTTSLLTWRGIVLLGTSGGLLPSPSAFLVLLTGLLTGRVGTAAAMVAAFGVGMALTLTGVGLIVLRGRDALLARAAGSPTLRTWSRRVPIVAASAVVAGGTVASALAAGRVLAP
ncbi:urease accessory protein UreH domain-containing protein [Streptomyces lunaelactis]|uniref:urease accessory protein UreH domain-containing protein n=1 Tax=Streptomyces lunaelactis TaxID=1535768 RepID=UPI00211D63B2|nr:sulfite exporter TauE/SafE family protein [Streptomyces lunaelactis]